MLFCFIFNCVSQMTGQVFSIQTVLCLMESCIMRKKIISRKFETNMRTQTMSRRKKIKRCHTNPTETVTVKVLQVQQMPLPPLRHSLENQKAAEDEREKKEVHVCLYSALQVTFQSTVIGLLTEHQYLLPADVVGFHY